MTRFARAKGSKSSNLKAPDDSTPWEVMKEQMLQAKKESEDNKNRELAENQRIENYSNFLKEQKVIKRKATWCEFPEAENNKKLKKQPSSGENNYAIKTNKKKDKLKNNSAEHAKSVHEVQETVNKDISSNVPNKKKKKINKSIAEKVTSEPAQDLHVPGIETEDIEHKENTESQEVIEHKKGKANKKKNKLKNNSANHAKSVQEVQVEEVQETVNNEISSNVPNKKKKKKNKSITEKVTSEPEHDLHVTGIETEDIEHTENTESQEVIKHKKGKTNKKKIVQGETDVKTVGTDNNQSNKQGNGTQKKKNKKTRGEKPQRRKEINDKSFQFIINGKEVELIRFDGFPIMKKDAERLKELKTNMMKKGIPKSEVNRTIKLERRRAEKALARLKRDVCYNCRKGGHNLSDCPDLKSSIPGVDAAEGVCFKCGSTEHRQFECKVQRDKEFRFASCFICKEQGHIARQCPDNPKGLYPNGGCCKLCGDVTHLRKDCPTVQTKNEGTSIKLQTLETGSNIEEIDLQSKPFTKDVPKKPKKIKF